MKIFLAVTVCAAALVLAAFWLRYRRSEYFRQTGNSRLRVRLDKGLSGEYAVYAALRNLNGHKRFLFNMYVPADNGETTEVDVVMLHESGIYVFESKNFSGWIFGSEKQTHWTQTLPAGKGKPALKNKFFNPLLQNGGHVKRLAAYLSGEPLPFHSYVVFGDGCELKRVSCGAGHTVVNLSGLFSAVRRRASAEGVRMGREKIDELYGKLLPLTRTGDAAKLRHVSDVEHRNDGRGF